MADFSLVVEEQKIDNPRKSLPAQATIEIPLTQRTTKSKVKKQVAVSKVSSPSPMIKQMKV